MRVAEELSARHGVDVAYPTLTAFCRRHGIGVKPKQPAGRYHFEPGEEMQHDTSPHRVCVGGREVLVQCASLVLCYSRRLFVQVYPTFRRFHCMAFLTAGLRHFGGAADRCMVDNTSVVIASGTGKNAVPALELTAFAERFGFHFEAHEIGDANRSARVERNFGYIEGNFYPGRTFASFADVNEQAVVWCHKRDQILKTELQARPIELFAVEQSALEPLPLHIPEIYDLHERAVDVEGYVHLHRNSYSVPAELIGRRVEVRESVEHVRVFYKRRQMIQHDIESPGMRKRVTHPDHRGRARRKRGPAPTLPQEGPLRAAAPELGTLVDRLRKHHGGRVARPLRRLHRMFLDYPTEPLVAAVRQANAHDLYDIGRIERMVLRRIAGDIFRLPIGPTTEEEDGDARRHRAAARESQTQGHSGNHRA